MWKPQLALGGVLGFLASQVVAVFTDEANVIDWHRVQIGLVTDILNFELPSEQGSTPCYAVYTESNVLAVLNGTDQSLLWRRKLDESYGKHFLSLVGKSSAVLAVNTQDGQGSRVFNWDLQTGSLEFETGIGADVTAIGVVESSVYVATGKQVHFLDAGLAIPASDKIDTTISGFITAGKGIYTVSSTGNKLETRKIDANDVSLGPSFNVGSGELLYSDDELIASIESGTVTVAKFENGKVSETISENGDLLFVTDKVLLISSASKSVAFDLDTFAELYILEGVHRFGRVAGNADVFAAVDSDGLVSLLDATSGQLLHKFELGYSGLPLAVSGNKEGLLVQHRNGVLQLVDVANKDVKAERDESLATIEAALLIDLPDTNEGSLDLNELWYEEHSNIALAYISRVRRHLVDLTYFWSAFKRGVASVVALETPEQQLSRANSFGLRKYFVSVSSTGRVSAIDTFYNHAIWSLDDLRIADAIVKSVDTTIFIASKQGTVTVIDALDGAIIKTLQVGEKIEDIIETTQEDSTTLYAWTESDKLVRLAGEDAGAFYTTKSTESSILGFSYFEGALTQTWEFTAPAGGVIAATAHRDSRDTTINIGNALGDRSVLYKYLHKNILAVASTNKEDLSLSVHVIDTVTGRILHTKTHEDQVDVSKGVKLVYGEHWLVYTFWSDLPTLGEKVVVWDLYESEIPNQHTIVDEYSSFDSYSAPHVKSQSFFAPFHFSALSLTRSRFGVTVRDVVASTVSNQIVSIPKRVLEPRRPIDRAATNNELSEGLFTYDSKLSIDPSSQVLSHDLSVLGTHGILTTAARLESTSVVVAYGFDVFSTQVTPSRQFDVLNSSFAKEKLIYTVGIMTSVVIYLKPLVARRMANSKWGKE